MLIVVLISSVGEAVAVWNLWTALRRGQWSLAGEPLDRHARPASFWAATAVNLLALGVWPVAAAVLLTMAPRTPH
jgi:hypothetical protein